MIRKKSWANLPLKRIAKSITTTYGLPLVAGSLLSVSSLLVFVWLASEVFEGAWQSFDEAIRNALHGASNPVLTRLMIGLSFLGSPGVLAAIGIAAVGALLYVKWKRAAALFVVTMTGEIILDLCLKGYYRRVRPEPFFNYVLPTSYSFPSGHALGSFCFYGSLAWLISRRIENGGIAWSLRSCAAVLILMIGISRIYLGVHFPSDVIGGFLAAFIWTLTVILADAYLDARS